MVINGVQYKTLKFILKLNPCVLPVYKLLNLNFLLCKYKPHTLILIKFMNKDQNSVYEKLLDEQEARILSKLPTLRYNYALTDIGTNINEVNPVAFFARDDEKPSPFQRLMRSFHVLNPSVWVVLAITGTIAGLLAFVIEVMSVKLVESKVFFSDVEEWWLQGMIWLSYSLLFGFIAAACGRYISIDAEGSGIPEMKAILGGVNIYRYLSLQTLSAKVIGLISASAAGMSIGKAGPMVHINCIIAQKLTKLSIFSHIYENATLRNQILASAVSAGLAATFGAPIGGVLFSIEVCATYYVVSNLWKAFFCATWCSLVFKILNSSKITDLIVQTDYQAIEFDWQIFTFLGLGLFSGLLGSAAVHFLSWLITLRRTKKWGQLHHRFPYTFFVVSLCTIAAMSFPFYKLADRKLINQMFSPMAFTDYDNPWTTYSVFTSLSIFVVLKFLLNAFSISCQIPAGVFIPYFTLGAAFGRLYGHVVSLLFGVSYPGVYALVGAAATASSVTHTLSSVVIVFELTGQIHYLSYMLVGCLTSFAVANSLGMSIFDVLLEMKGLPYMPALKPTALYLKKASDIMSTSISTITKDTTLFELAKTIHESLKNLYKIPIVDRELHLASEVSVSDLRKYLNHTYEANKYKLQEHSQIELNRYFDKLYHISDTTNRFMDYVSDTFRSVDEVSALCDNDPAVAEFWNTPIDLKSPALVVDHAPLSVPEHTPLAKVHYLFLMLGLSQLYITHKGALKGVITRDSFIKLK